MQKIVRKELITVLNINTGEKFIFLTQKDASDFIGVNYHTLTSSIRRGGVIFKTWAVRKEIQEVNLYEKKN